MPVIKAKSELGALLEEVLDNEEEHISEEVFDELVRVYEELDREALEKEQRIEKLEEEVERLEEHVVELEGRLGL